MLRNKISSSLHKMDLVKSDPEYVISTMARPTAQTFIGIKKKLRECDQEWMQSFLDLHGLKRLLDCVDTFANRRVKNLSDAMVLIECVECIRAVLNSKIGISVLVQKKEYNRSLIKAMDTNNAMVKKPVIELLSALCMYSEDGYRLAMDALDTYKTLKQMRYRFSLLVNELKSCELVPYKTSLMAFINCILCASDDLYDRNKIRNEFVGLNILDIIPELRNCEDKELDIQCDVFDDFKHDDDEDLALTVSDDIDVTNHKEIFDVIFTKTYNTPLSDKFLTILQTLLQIEQDTRISDLQWDLMEHAAQKAVVLDESKVDKNRNVDQIVAKSLKLAVKRFKGIDESLGNTSSSSSVPLRDMSVQTSVDFDQCSTNEAVLTSIKESLEEASNDSLMDVKTAIRTTTPDGPPTPPPPPPPPGPPPPPPAGPPPPPPDLSQGVVSHPIHGIDIPKPKRKMKIFHWDKIPAASLSIEDNVWKIVLGMDDKVTVKYDTIEDLFCQKTAHAIKKEQSESEKEKTPAVVNLLAMKRSMNANIFLAQFKGTSDEIVKMIQHGDVTVIGPERLRGLQKIMPKADEISMIENYDGDKTKLGNAEKFYLQLSNLNGFQIGIEGMLLREDLQVANSSLRPNVQSVITACKKLMNNDSLKGFLRYVLHAGNFINAGGYAGNAVAFKIGSLNKLIDIRANKPLTAVTLLHYLVDEAKNEKDAVLDFADELEPVLMKASKLTIDDLRAEANKLEGNVRDLKTRVDESREDIQKQFEPIINEAQADVNKVKKDLNNIQNLATKLSHHFCEEKRTFKFEECLNNMSEFCQKVKQCAKDNEQRKLQEERAERRRKENESMKINIASKESSMPADEDGRIVDNLLSDIRKGYSLRKTTPGRRRPNNFK